MWEYILQFNIIYSFYENIQIRFENNVVIQWS